MDLSSTFLKYKNRKDRYKTIITSDTYDVYQTESNNQENRQRNGSLNRTKSKPRPHKKQQTQPKKHNKSLQSALVQSRIRDNTPRSKINRMMSICQNDGGRLKTDYSQANEPYVFKRMVSELKKKIVFPVNENYRLDAFKILKKVHQTPHQQFYTAKMGTTHQQKKYTLIKLKQSKIKPYEQEIKAYNQISKSVAKKQRKVLRKINHIWKQKKHWMVVTDNYLSANWHDDEFYLFLNQFKNNQGLVTLLMQQMAISILIISNTGRAHTKINLNALHFPLVKGQLKAEGLIKIGGLSNCIAIKNKSQLLKMPISYQTPPEVLNFILFDQGQTFDREHLEEVSELKQGWQVDTWALGIMVLQLLNGGPLASQGCDCHQLISLQRELLIRYSYLLEKLDRRSHLCLCNMLTFSPKSRPHPLQILQILQGSN